MTRLRFVLFIALAACGKTKGRLHVENAFANVVPSGAGAAYFDIVNDSGEPERLEEVDSTAAADAQLHEIVRNGDVTSMHALERGIVITPHTTVHLARGGQHVMLFGLQAPTPATIPLTLHFAHAGDVRIDAAVRPILGDPR